MFFFLLFYNIKIIYIPSINHSAVSSIKKKHLAEVRSMANPPAVVKLALESVCLMVNEPASDWKSIRQVLVKDSFIPSIVNYDTASITYDNGFYNKFFIYFLYLIALKKKKYNFL